jgi:hypothetical protein
VLGVCLLTGCWETIVYEESSSPTAQRDSEPSVPVAATVSPVERPVIRPSQPTDTEASTESPDSTAIPVAADPTAEPPLEVAPSTSEGSAAIDTPTSATSDTPTAASPDIAPESPPESAPATAVSPPAESTATVPHPSVSTQRAAWRLGSDLSIAALANERGIAANQIPKWVAETQEMARLLNVTVATLPDRPAEVPATGAPNAVKYLAGQLTSIRGQLDSTYGIEHAALFDLALRSNLLLVYNNPSTPGVQQIAKSVADVAPRTNLPNSLWQPLLDALAKRAPEAEVRLTVRKLHADVDAHLANVAGAAAP